VAPRGDPIREKKPPPEGKKPFEEMEKKRGFNPQSEMCNPNERPQNCKRQEIPKKGNFKGPRPVGKNGLTAQMGPKFGAFVG